MTSFPVASMTLVPSGTARSAPMFLHVTEIITNFCSLSHRCKHSVIISGRTRQEFSLWGRGAEIYDTVLTAAVSP